MLRGFPINAIIQLIMTLKLFQILPTNFELTSVKDGKKHFTLFSLTVTLAFSGNNRRHGLPKYGQLEKAFIKALRTSVQSKYPEKRFQVRWPGILAVDNKITKQELDKAFRQILKDLVSGYEGKPRRKPIRVKRLSKLFLQEPNRAIGLSMIANEFGETIDPEKSASTAVGWLNRAFKAAGMKMRIERESFYIIKRT